MALFAVVARFKHLGEFILRVAGERVVVRVRTSIFGDLLASDVAFFDISSTGELVSVLSTESDGRQPLVSSMWQVCFHEQTLGGHKMRLLETES